MLRSSLTILLTLAAAAGCKRQASPSLSQSVAAAPAQVRTPGKGATEAGLEPHVPSIYIDGEPRAAFAYNELPATLALDGEHRAQVV